MLNIDHKTVHLWFLFLDEHIDEDLLVRYLDLLSPEEQRQHTRFYFGSDRYCYLLTRVLVRTVLSRYAAVGPREWVFTTNAFGKPRILNPGNRAETISFSVSHTKGLVLLGVTRAIALGVDVENCNARRPSVDLADGFFSADEVHALRAMPLAQQHERFIEYWTLKESYVKARGMGLTIPFDQFSFYFPSDGTVGVAMKAELEDKPSRWRFWQFRPATEYVAAVCMERSNHIVPQLTIRRIVPMSKEEQLDYTLLRTSD